MSKLLSFDEVAEELDVVNSHLNYVLNRDGITAAERSGRGRGGGRMFRHSQLVTIKKSLAATRKYKSRDAWASGY